MAERYWLVVPAAGVGSRFGGGTPKQYLPLGGRTVLEHALSCFLADQRLEGVVVALAPGDCRFERLPLAKDQRLRSVTGGARRADSVRAALEAVAAATSGDPWVLVHDAVRPCLARRDLARLLAALSEAPQGALLAVPVADTLKRADAHGRVQSTVAREGLWAAQTPQAFRLATLRAMLIAGSEATDESSAAERMGLKPRLIMGSVANLKVTMPEDLALAEHVLALARPAEVT